MKTYAIAGNVIGRKVGGGGNGPGWQEEMMYTLDTNGGGFAIAINHEDTSNNAISPDVLRCERPEEGQAERRPLHNGKCG